MQIDISGLSVRYGDFLAVDDIDLRIHDGEMVVLLGPSGCGKTTVMRAIVGLETPYAGRIVVGDRTVFDGGAGIDVPTNRRGIGMVFQSYAIWPHKTVLENVTFPLRVQGRSKGRDVDARGRELLESMGLVDQAEKGASQLSGGQMQRVALARSLAMESSVLLLDEPLSNLDASLRDRLRFDLKDLQFEFGFTAMYVTHDLDEALAIADRIAVMREGRIEQLATPREIYDNPANAFVADVLGVTNAFPAVEVTRAPAGDRVATIDSGAKFVSSRPAPEGQSVTVCIRPDHVCVHPADGAPESVNAFSGQLTVSSFLGDEVRYKVRGDSGLVLDVSSHDVEGQIEAGTRVTATVAPEHVMLLSSESAT